MKLAFRLPLYPAPLPATADLDQVASVSQILQPSAGSQLTTCLILIFTRSELLIYDPIGKKKARHMGDKTPQRRRSQQMVGANATIYFVFLVFFWLIR